MAHVIPVDIFEQRGQKWSFYHSNLDAYLSRTSQESGPKSTCFVFAESELLKNNDPRSAPLHSKLQKFYGMPAEIWSNVHWEANGYFGCRDGDLDRHDTWFRFLVKQLIKGGDPTRQFPMDYDYKWYKMGFFSTWSQSGHKSILCLDCPQDLIISVRLSLDNCSNDHFLVDPYSFHQIIIRGIVNIYDNSIWTIRDVVRDVEKAGYRKDLSTGTVASNTTQSLQNRPNNRKPEPNFDHLHEAGRHVIHSTETLIVATQESERIMVRQRERMDRLTNAAEEEKRCMIQIGDNLRFYHGMIYAFKARSESMQARHQSEIGLAFNTVAQYHSRVAVEDAAAMKVIAALTVAFLPATFVSAVFSMSFFNNQGGDDGWSISDKFWIYWAFAIPLTIATVILLILGSKILRYL
ncbi:hypothetical protein H072_3950 [Dactylellina haptotyla CBS 200.50]|uniref:Uncharacterized protein n=1 Tax=Dactylellina haptotyla (strain CBS 200.50) TaxID=1284197 RepID=S8BRI2_DACHA|nr:hypothetical protein H072_3950 [Dactylellina haptotyla CBS 200.50]